MQRRAAKRNAAQWQGCVSWAGYPLLSQSQNAKGTPLPKGSAGQCLRAPSRTASRADPERRDGFRTNGPDFLVEPAKLATATVSHGKRWIARSFQERNLNKNKAIAGAFSPCAPAQPPGGQVARSDEDTASMKKTTLELVGIFQANNDIPGLLTQRSMRPFAHTSY